jgi:hypothetical protein
MRLGEAVVEFLNSNAIKPLFAQIDEPVALSLFWDAERKRFLPGKSQLRIHNRETPKSDEGVMSSRSKPRVRKSWNPLGQKPPQEEDYFVPILQALRHFNWSATPRQITPLVLDKMRPRLSEEDFDWIPSGMFIRWECRMRFARKRMIEHNPPLLNPNSPRGVWGATEAGRRYLEEWENKSHSR